MNQTTSCARLSSLAVLRLSGEDAAGFLQGQLTNDVTKLASDALLTAGWCSPRGRLLTVFRLVKDGDDILIILPADDLEAAMKRLRMYILRSRVRLTKETTLAVVGLVGGASMETAGRVFAQTSGAPEALAALGLAEGRALALVAAEDAPANTDESLYWAASAAAGDAFVFVAVKDQFVPQAINLELTDGVSFTKGCYTGQEIVSRVEHIGKTPRRGALYAAEKPLPAGTVLTDASGAEAGIVIYGAAAPKAAALFLQLPNEQLGKPLAANGLTLTPLPLPYSYERRH